LHLSYACLLSNYNLATAELRDAVSGDRDFRISGYDDLLSLVLTFYFLSLPIFGSYTFLSIPTPFRENNVFIYNTNT
jgi:hypothetical protein